MEFKSIDKVAVFYMIGQFGEESNWKAMFYEQLDALKQSGLYDAMEFIDIFVKGTDPIPKEEYAIIGDKVNNVTYLGDLEEDKPTNHKLYRAYNQIMQRIWAFSNANPEYKVLFFHSLGVSRSHIASTSTKIGDQLVADRTVAYRKYFEFFVIHSWRDCLRILDHYDCAGAEYVPTATFAGGTIHFEAPHYAGFFWWANANYLKKLNPCYFYQDVVWQAYLCELWIGSGNPNAYSIYNCGRNRYYEDLGPIPYEEILENTRNHIKQLDNQGVTNFFAIMDENG